MHELMHRIVGKDDHDIMKVLAAFDQGARINPGGPSVQITNWLRSYCVGGRGNR
jgi:hypothetical protein